MHGCDTEYLKQRKSFLPLSPIGCRSLGNCQFQASSAVCQQRKNPVDFAKRGMYTKEITQNNRWIIVPQFLWQRDSEWLDKAVFMVSLGQTRKSSLAS